MPARRKHDEIEKLVGELGYVLLKDYRYKNYQKVIIQDSDGYKYDTDIQNLLDTRTKKLAIVHKNNSYSLENISLWLFLNRSEFEICKDNIYQGNKENLRFYHIVCKGYFLASWNSISFGNGCPACSGKIVTDKNRLSVLFPEIASEWHPTKNGNLTANDVSYGSTKKVWWRCSNGHDHISSVLNKINGTICPICSGKIISNLNRLSVCFPEISSEWNYNRNKDTPDDVSFGSNKKRWWICRNGHEYLSQIGHRTQGRGCEQCAIEQSESKMAFGLKEHYKQYDRAIPEYRIFRNPKTNMWLPYDIYIPCGYDSKINGIYIEIHGQQHYEKKTKFHKTDDEFEYQKYKDKLKKNFAKKNGIYIEIDLRKIKTVEEAINYIENIVGRSTEEENR